MFYQAYQLWTDLMTPARLAASAALSMRDSLGPMGEWAGPRRFFSLADMLAHTKVTHTRPPFNITSVRSGNDDLPVREEVALALPFANLLRFAKDTLTPKPKVLVVAPLSGHFATLLRSTVATLLRDHDVYVTDWANARDVPLSAGRFGFDDYVDYVIRFIEELGPGANLLAVCQPCVPAIAAVALMAEDKNPLQPRTMTLMGGPLDTRVAPTVVNTLATSKPLSWFEETLIDRVPLRYRGRGRRVYPGFLQLSAFMSMNMGRHIGQHRALYQFMADGQDEAAQTIKDFYEEYFAVLDMDADYYIETVDRIFQRALLPRGLLEHRGRRVKPELIHKTALLTIEGERDDICAVGQTAAAHEMCSGLRPHLKRHYLQPGVGHYGVFSGSRWERQIYPQVRNHILAMM